MIAGISYELLKWAGRSDNIVVKILSLPGLYLQKITTSEPDDDMLEVAIAAVNSCMDDEPPTDKCIPAEVCTEDESGEDKLTEETIFEEDRPEEEREI